MAGGPAHGPPAFREVNRRTPLQSRPVTAPLPDLILYGRPGCHLCEDAHAILDALLVRARGDAACPCPRSSSRNIEDDEAWHAATSSRSPWSPSGDRELELATSAAKIGRFLAEDARRRAGRRERRLHVPRRRGRGPHLVPLALRPAAGARVPRPADRGGGGRPGRPPRAGRPAGRRSATPSSSSPASGPCSRSSAITAAFAGGAIADYIKPLRIIGGAVLVVMGLSLAGILRIPVLERTWRPLDAGASASLATTTGGMSLAPGRGRRGWRPGREQAGRRAVRVRRLVRAGRRVRDRLDAVHRRDPRRDPDDGRHVRGQAPGRAAAGRLHGRPRPPVHPDRRVLRPVPRPRAVPRPARAHRLAGRRPAGRRDRARDDVRHAGAAAAGTSSSLRRCDGRPAPETSSGVAPEPARPPARDRPVLVAPAADGGRRDRASRRWG